MAKNIVVCCDGTGNEFGDRNSNVVKLCSALVIDPNTQISYYHPGVGTMGSPTARGWLENKISVINGLAFGGGILDRIADAYRYLMDNYEEKVVNGKVEKDRIFLFGFSRGAYTARALGALLYMYGLLHPGNQGLIPYIIKEFARKTKETQGMAHTFEVAAGFKDAYSQNVWIHFVGVWDTVSSVGWITDPLTLPYTAVNPIMEIGRHAVSLDERRCFFRDNLWGKPVAPEDPRLPWPQDIKQVWFAGVHSDIGGSYAEGESGLSKITLEWMLHEARDAGLILDEKKTKRIFRLGSPASFAPPDATDGQHESLKGLWWIVECLPHYKYDKTKGRPRWTWPPFGARRHFPEDGIVVHESVVKRLEKLPAYQKKTLPPKYDTEKYVPLFPNLHDSQQLGEKRFNGLEESGRLQAILNFRLDAYPLKWDRPDMQPSFSGIAAVLAVVATLLFGEHWPQKLLAIPGELFFVKHWPKELLAFTAKLPLKEYWPLAALALLEIVVLWLMRQGARKRYRLGDIKRRLAKEKTDYAYPEWKAACQFAAGLFAAGVVLLSLPSENYPWLAAALVLVAVGLVPALTTVTVARAYNAVLDAWEDASHRPEFLAYKQRLSGRPAASGQSGQQDHMPKPVKAQTQETGRVLARFFSRIQLLAEIGAVLTSLLFGAATGLVVRLWRGASSGTIWPLVFGLVVAVLVYAAVRPASDMMASLVNARKLFLDDLITGSESDQMRRKCLKDTLLYE